MLFNKFHLKFDLLCNDFYLNNTVGSLNSMKLHHLGSVKKRKKDHFYKWWFSMAQNVCSSKMTEDTWILREDGYLNADIELRKIVYHPPLNVILICTNSGSVRVIDVNSGVVLQTSDLSAQSQSNLTCRYISGHDRILFCDGQALGVRSDYNGVLLLDTILQKPVTNSRDDCKIELLLSEAIILKQCLLNVSPTKDCVINELTEKILEAQKESKKGIKAQKWNTICLELPLEYLRAATNSSITELIAKNQHMPELGVASAVQERLSDLVNEPANVSDRRSMASEAKRRDTFTHWPHMDYKWALPDQMAQAGFYHQPNASGDDRAMCFTCAVCLVCWERTDEPWSEHERHSPNCPFVMGEYTQNVPLSVTYATNPAIDATYRGVFVNVIGTSSVPHLLATSNNEGLITVFSISGKLKRLHSFFVTQYDCHILDKFTQDFGVPGIWTDNEDVKYPTINKRITALSIVSDNSQNKTLTIRPTIICGLNIRCKTTSKSRYKKSESIESLNDQNRNDTLHIMEVDQMPELKEHSCLYLVVYDFLYKKEQTDKEQVVVIQDDNSTTTTQQQQQQQQETDEIKKIWKYPTFSLINENDEDISFLSNYNIVKQQLTMYQNLIPGESDEIFLPPTTKHSGPRVLPIEMQNNDCGYVPVHPLFPQDYSFMNGQLDNNTTTNNITPTTNTTSTTILTSTPEKTISDHITELKNSLKTNKKLNYSRAVQCVSLPEKYKTFKELEINEIVSTIDYKHVIVLLKSNTNNVNSVLLLYSLDFKSSSMVKINEEPVLIRELYQNERPVEMNLLPQLDNNSKVIGGGVQNVDDSGGGGPPEGMLLLVCEDGAVRILELANFNTVSIAKLEDEKFVSAVYCNSLERLCASTSKGSLHFYTLNDSDNYSNEDHEEDEQLNFTGGDTIASQYGQSSQSTDYYLETTDLMKCFREPYEIITKNELKKLHQLINFEPYKPGYCAVVPPCWSEMQQAQRQRRLPQHLNMDTEQYTKTWRLQTDTTTWDEHIFEIMLPTSSFIGHVDVHFTLHPSAVLPRVEITLLKQNNNGIGHKKDFKFSVDDQIRIDSLFNNENPVTSQEYLRAYNADILAGPIDISNGLDLSDLNGCITLTSPKLFKLRTRSLLLHIKAVKEEDNRNSKIKRFDCSIRKTEYMGCDCLHELSVTIYSSKLIDIQNERSLRCLMIESNIYLNCLVLTAIQDDSIELKGLALDVLNWIGCIRLMRNRCQNGDVPIYQKEYLKVVEGNVCELIRKCLLKSSRHVAHKCVKLMVVCSNGSRNLEDSTKSRFDSTLLEALLDVLNDIEQIQSAGGLQWLMLLLYRVTHQERLQEITGKCLTLLSRISDELCQRTNPYHLILRSHFGLYGTPLEPELFDIEPPPPGKASSTSVTYASVVSGDNSGNGPSSDFHTNYAFNKENLDPKDVLTTTPDSKIKLRNITPSRLFRGLLETEPLHFTCVSASDGTRLERADVGHNNIINFVPLSVTASQNTVGTKKVEIEQYYDECPYNSAVTKLEKLSNNGQGSSNNATSLVDNVYQMIIHADNLKNEDFAKLITDTLEITVDAEVHAQMFPDEGKTVKRAEEILSPNKSLPWPQLLISPTQQVIVVERMHSGARRFVTLDFGQSILLTDVLIPICHDLVSISIDLWLKSEDVDGMRLVVSSDIGTRNLVLNDLQPPPLCRYMKITMIGRYGMSTTRCRIPTGYYYGHLIVLPEEVPDNVPTMTDVDVANQLNTLNVLYEDVSCRYSLSCSKLKELLNPFLSSDVSNTAHLAAYMDITRDKNNGTQSQDNVKIFNAYQEAITYQRQLNTVRNVMNRIETSLKKQCTLKKCYDLQETSTDKLRCIAECLLEVLLTTDSIPNIDEDMCDKLFQGLCVSERSRLQFLTAILLDRSCRKQQFWGSFLSETLYEMFSSLYTLKFPQDRVFVLLSLLVRRCTEKSTVFDGTLKVITKCLLPLSTNNQTLLGINVDLPLLGWLLLFLSLQLDLSKNTFTNSTRWDWVTGEMGQKLKNEDSPKNRKKKVHKLAQNKKDIDDLDFTQNVLQNTKQFYSCALGKMEVAYKCKESYLKKVKPYKAKDSSQQQQQHQQQPNKSTNNELNEANHSKSTSKRRWDSREGTNEKQNIQQLPQTINSNHCRVVCKGLLTLLLNIDHSCCSDMFLLSCKVLGRLSRMSNLSLSDLMSEQDLIKLIELCINSELQWASYALACLLQDSLEFSGSNQTAEHEETSWRGAELLTEMEAFDVDENVITEPIIKSTKTNNKISQLSSVYESDDSEDFSDFLDGILERGRIILKKQSKTSHLTYSGSSAVDSRLEIGVEIQSEITLKRLIMLNTHHLAQTITSNLPNVNNDTIQLEQWPDELTESWNLTQNTEKSNRQMLVGCFDVLCKKLRTQSPVNMERTLQLLLTLSCNGSTDKFNPAVIPYIDLSQDAITSLITAISWTSSLSLRCWCSALQILTLSCNLPYGGVAGASSSTNTQWMDNYEPFGMVPSILNHPDFVQFFLRLLSGTGLVFSEKGLAGPSLCKALHDLLVRLQMRCDVVSPSSKPGSTLKTLLLKIVYQLVQPTGPLISRQGPLDAQCKMLQTMIYLDYENADLSIAMSILESTGILVHNYVSNVERIKCMNIGEHLSPSSNSFSLFASVLGTDAKQDRLVSWDSLLISLLKLLGKIVQTPLPNNSTNDGEDVMETETTSQTDESKAEQIQQDYLRETPSVPCLADTVLQHHPTIIYLCQALAACKASSLSMLANISHQNNTYPDLGEPGSVGDAVFNVLAALVKKASQKNRIMEPLLIFLSQTSQLSEPLLWFILQVLDNGESLKYFLEAGGIKILGESLVKSSNAPNTISIAGTTSMVMQHFMGFKVRSDASAAIAGSSSAKKHQQTCIENTMSLVNFAPFGTIRCQSGTAQPADVLIQGGTATHRRARTPQWSYHFYPEETHTELTLQLPNAILLREVHLQPHIGALATCPSAVALEVSADGPSRLVPTCPPLPTSGMTFIRLNLPIPEVVNCIQLRLYKPRDTNHIGLSQIRVLGTSAFGVSIVTQVMDLSEDESHCKYSLGWLRLLHHCITLGNESNLSKRIIASAAQVPNLLKTCCGLLLVPTHIPTLYLSNLEKVLRELTLFSRTNGLNAIKVLLQCKPHVSEPINLIQNYGTSSSLSGGGRFLMNSPGSQSVCELLYQVCRHQDEDTPFRIAILLEWLKTVTEQSLRAGNTDSCTPSYISSIAFIIWASKTDEITYNLPSMITIDLFNSLYNLIKISSDNLALKYSLDSILCAFCYVKSELFPMLLQHMDVLVPNLTTDHDASISDDRKDSDRMTDDNKSNFESNSEWYGRLIIRNLSELYLTEEQLDTIALVSRSPTAVQQLLDSGLPTLLSKAILEFCGGRMNYAMSQLDSVKAILKFFADVSEEKVMRDWLGTTESSQFWSPLLNYLCNWQETKQSYIKTETHGQLEEMCVKFLSKCCLCHHNNQLLLSNVLCEVISKQKNGITGFMRRLILQLLLENEKVPVSITSEDTLYKNNFGSNCFVPVHPTFNQTNNKTLMYLGTNLTLADILDQYISFSSTSGVKCDGNGANNKKEQQWNGSDQIDLKSLYSMALADSDLSMAAGVTAKDKRAKDVKNQNVVAPKLKKKRYTISECSTASIDILEGKVIRCDALPYKNLSFHLTLAQVLKMMEDQGCTQDWPCIYLTISQNKNVDDDNGKCKSKSSGLYPPLSCALQVFSSMGGLSLLAQHLPTVYSESVRPQTNEKPLADQSESDWVKVEGNDDIYEDIEEGPTIGGTTTKSSGIIPNVPPHSLTAFGLFLRLPGYADYLLRDMKKALCLLRLVLGVTDDGEGVDIFQTPVADSLPTLPFEVLRKLYDSTPLSTDDGRLLRRLSINLGVVHLLLACLGIFTHQTQINNQKENKNKDDRGQLYWAKGTGFGTGSTQQSWNVEQALMKQRSEEEHVTVLLQVLSSYINPTGEDEEDVMSNVLPPTFLQLLANSSLLPALSSYLRNDSVLDMARHIPLYKAALELLRAIALNSQLVSLLIPEKTKSGPSISSLLKNMKTCVDTYASKLRSAKTNKSLQEMLNNKPTSAKHKMKGEQYDEVDRDEGLAMLMPEIQMTATLVCDATEQFADAAEQEMIRESNLEKSFITSVEEHYLKIMKQMQFDTFEMIQELPENGGYKFVISHHFEMIARSAGDTSHPARVKRLAQEAVTLATSLPLSYSSSVFVRCDTDRLDIMKVLITGPAETPYANGCFEFDVYFPPDYPLTPMMINLETTGYHTVRFNPNLYNDGKVCLSVLNTWHGRPEEKWNAQTSSFLQVLVSIQSLILVPEPYFNEPGYERSRGTPSGTQSSKEYNANICQATVRWAMLEQIVNPCPCFKDVIQAHFYLKRQEIMDQVENWIKEQQNEVCERRTAKSNKRSTFSNVEGLKKVYEQLKEKLLTLTPPSSSITAAAVAASSTITTTATTSSSCSSSSASASNSSAVGGTDKVENTSQQLNNNEVVDDASTDIDMEKMVNEMCN